MPDPLDAAREAAARAACRATCLDSKPGRHCATFCDAHPESICMMQSRRAANAAVVAFLESLAARGALRLPTSPDHLRIISAGALRDLAAAVARAGGRDG